MGVVTRLAAVAAGIGLIAAAYAWLNAKQPPHLVGIGEPIRQDDFLYTVVGVAKARSIGAAANRAVAHGDFYVVGIEVANRAQRVDYRWDPSIAYVVDGAGRTYQFSVEGQRALDASQDTSNIIAAGQTARYQVAFDLPRNAEHPQLAFSNGIMMGDVFDGAAYMRARVPLN